MHEKLLTMEDVARYLGIPESEIQGIVEKGELPAYKIGGHLLRFKQEQVESYRQRRESDLLAKQALLGDRVIKNGFTQIVPESGASTGRKSAAKMSEAVSYTALEKLEDFLYYNDFYILSLILLLLVVFAVFGL